MTKKECNHFDSCSAPICPLDAESLENCYWFPDEEICKNTAEKKNWIKRQRKIARVVEDKETYYTVAMLKHNCQIKQATKGIDPDGTDGEREAAEEKWIASRETIKELSPERKKELAEKLRSNLQSVAS